MYEETACFDPNNSVLDESTESTTTVPLVMAAAGSRTNSHSGGGFDDDHVEDLRISMVQDASVTQMEFERQLQLDMEHSHDLDNNNNEFLMMQQQQLQMIHNHESNQIVVSFDDQSNWEQIEMQNAHHPHQNHQMFNPTADLLNRFHLPGCSIPNSSVSYQAETDPTSYQFHTQQSLNLPNSFSFLTNNHAIDNTSSSVMYDPLFHLNLPPQPPIFRELFQSPLSNAYSSLPGSRLGGSFYGVDEREASGGVVYQDADSGVLEFTAGTIGRKRRGRNGKSSDHLSTERLRRDHFSTQYQSLKKLIPNPTKNDRASIVGDAIEYINGLMRTVSNLKALVEEKRCSKERRKRLKTEEDNGEESVNNVKPNGGRTSDQYHNGASRSSWLQRKSKDTEVDVRIVDDDVTIKLVQRKKINCLLLVSKFLDELHLDLQHAAGGHIGDFNSFLFNSKINEGSFMYASAVANNLIEVMDKQFAEYSHAAP